MPTEIAQSHCKDSVTRRQTRYVPALRRLNYTKTQGTYQHCDDSVFAAISLHRVSCQPNCWVGSMIPWMRHTVTHSRHPNTVKPPTHTHCHHVTSMTMHYCALSIIDTLAVCASFNATCAGNKLPMHGEVRATTRGLISVSFWHSAARGCTQYTIFHVCYELLRNCEEIMFVAKMLV